MNLLIIIKYFIYALIFLKLSTFILMKVNKYLEDANFNRRLELGILSMQDLYKFGDDKFLELSKLYLEDIGITNINKDTFGIKYVDYTCELKNEKAYVHCLLEDLRDIQNSDAEINSVGRPDVQKFLGQMVHDEIKYGIIITNACCTNESECFTEQLNGNHRILLIDGYNFTRRIRKIKESNNFPGGVLNG